MPKIYDNMENKFSIGLSEHITNATRVDYCVGYFNLRGWKMVCDGINKLAGDNVIEKDNTVFRYCRLLVGMTKTPREELFEQFSNPENILMDNDKANRYRKKLAAEFIEQLTYGTPTQADENALQALLGQLKTGRLVVKLFLKHQLHAKLYLAHRGENIAPIIGLLGSSNFTLAGLSKQGELNVDVLEQDASLKLDKWFTDRWLDRWCINITTDLIEVLENSWARTEYIDPFMIYLKMAYHMSREARAGLAEFKLSNEFSNELLDFQQAAVKIAAHHIHNRHGVMIGDVVGLGKTITATAIAKVLEDDLYYNTLITCPKNLVPMWDHYREKYGLHARVVSHSMLRQTLPNLRRYRLLIIDESHNFRNSRGETYSALKSYIAENECKVILLSATPYNKSYTDLSNQLKLFLPENYDLGITPEQYIKAIGGIVEFTARHTDTNVRTINAFEKSNLADDWREVMKLYLVRRTRSFIKSNYAKTDTDSGRKYLEFSSGEKSFFPDRIPKKIEFAINGEDPSDQYATLYEENIVEAINTLNLPRYGIQQYYDDTKPIKPTKEERNILENMSKAGNSIIGFCRTNLYKRLESCGYSFLLSLSRHVLRNYIFLYAINNGLNLPVSGQSVVVDAYSDEDEETTGLNMNFGWTEDEYSTMASNFYSLFQKDYKARFQWIRSTLFETKKIVADLEEDNKKILAILTRIGSWKSEDDRKIDALEQLISQKHPTQKILVFTQYADTASYVFQELNSRKITKLGMAVGSSDNIVELVSRFSPTSNDFPNISQKEQIRVLITTDVLSEGQNLQDAHIIVNFDLPWALVRLIQRAGRVDRLGQKSSKIICYSFLPEEGIERILGLRKKLATRISQNAEVVGSDEIFFEGDPTNISDLYSEKSGIFDENEDVEVDLASYAYQIWKNAIDSHPDVKSKVENMPNVVFGAKANTSTLHDGSGVIVYARTKENNDALAWLDDKGQIVTQSQYAILKAAECDYTTKSLPKLPNHHNLVATSIGELQKESTAISGSLGRKNSVKYRVFMRLQRFLEEKEGTLFVPSGLKYALDTVYQYPLKENAVDTLSRQMRSGITDASLAELIVSLYDSDRLCSINTDSLEQNSTQIICSMSLIGERP